VRHILNVGSVRVGRRPRTDMAGSSTEDQAPQDLRRPQALPALRRKPRRAWQSSSSSRAGTTRYAVTKDSVASRRSSSSGVIQCMASTRLHTGLASSEGNPSRPGQKNVRVDQASGASHALVQRRTRLGGLLSFCHHAAAGDVGPDFLDRTSLASLFVTGDYWVERGSLW
jgi:hypothetical protein